MKIAVVGCGGNGGVVCGVLGSKGLDVVCIEAKEDYARLITERGVHLQGKKGEIRAKVRSYHGFSGKHSKFDIIIIAVKSNELRSVFLKAKEYVDEKGFILTLQNGLEILELSEEFPSVKVVAGAVGYNSIMLDYGEYLVTSNGGITVGNLKDSSLERLLLLKNIFEPGIKIDITKEIRAVLWAKLLIVCGVTGLGGVAGLLVGALLRQRVARKLFYRIVTEGVAVAEKLGINIEKFGGINPEKFGDHKGSYPLVLRYLLLKFIGSKYKKIKSNIHHSLEKGQKTEIDFLNGEVVRMGEKHGIDTPVNRGVVNMVREIEAEKREMGLKNLYEIYEKT